MSLATTRLAALPCLCCLNRRSEKERAEERGKERQRKRERRPVQFEHSKSRWPVPTVSLVSLGYTRLCRVVVLPSFGSKLTRSARGVYFRSVTFTNVCLAFATVAVRRSRNPDDVTRSPAISRVDVT